MDEVNRKSTLVTHENFEFWGNKGRLDFGMFAIVVSWIVVMVMVVVFEIGLHEKVTIINWPLTVRKKNCLDSKEKTHTCK